MPHVLGKLNVISVLLGMLVRLGFLLQRHVEMESIARWAPVRVNHVLPVLILLQVFTVSRQLTSAHPVHLGVTVLAEEPLSQDFVMQGISAFRTRLPRLIRPGLYPKMRFLPRTLVMAEL
jgi:hypothetical protein